MSPRMSPVATHSGGLRAYAAHRKASGLPGTTHKAVQRAIESDRLSKSVRKVDGGVTIIDFAAADREWAENTAEDPAAVKLRTSAKARERVAAHTTARSGQQLLIDADRFSVFVDREVVVLAYGNDEDALLFPISRATARVLAAALNKMANAPPNASDVNRG
jgi:hypothetical protein